MEVKSIISNFLRKVGLLEIADKLRFFFLRCKNRRINTRFSKENPLVKIPPDYFLYETYTLNYADYYKDGKSTAQEIINLFTDHYPKREKNRILDWGCGPGRITQHLDALIPGSIICATDYNPVYVYWCRTNIKNVEFSLNTLAPPLTYKDCSFDFVIGLSLFTHFSKEGHIAWFAEIWRVTKPGGIFFITTQGQSYRRKISVAEKEKFDKGELVVRSHFSEGNRLYSAFQPEPFIKNCIKNTFEILEYIPGSYNEKFEQDIWVLRKILPEGFIAP